MPRLPRGTHPRPAPPAAVLVAAWSAACADPTISSARAPCDPTGGVMCTYVGQPQLAMFTLDGLHRLDSATYFPRGALWGPDGRFYFSDSSNHRVRRVEPDDTVVTVVGGVFPGHGPDGPASDFALDLPTGLAFAPGDDTRLHVAAWYNARAAEVDLAAGTARFTVGTGIRGFGGDGGPASEANFDLVSSVAADDLGNLYLMDPLNQVLRRVDRDGTVTTFAGRVETRLQELDGNPATPPTEVTRGWPGYEGDGGPASEARFYAISGARAMPSHGMSIHDGTLYLADTDNHVIRAIDLETRTISRVAGRVEIGPAWPDWEDTPIVNLASGHDNGPAAQATFQRPTALAVGPDGTLYVADTDNHCVRRVRDGIVDTIAGVCGQPGDDEEGRPAWASRLYHPGGVAVRPDGSLLLIADSANHVIRAVGL